MTSLSFAENGTMAAPEETRSIRPLASVRDVPASKGADAVNKAGAVVREARSLTTAHPDSAMAWSRLAQAELVSSSCAVAVDAAQKAVGLAKAAGDRSSLLASVLVLLHCGQTQIAELELSSGDFASSDIIDTLLAGVLIDREDFTGALDRLRTAHTGEAAHLRGYACLRLRRFSEAVHEFRLAAKSLPPDPSLLANLAYAHAALGVFDKAIEETKQARSLASADRTIALNLAAYQRATGQFEEALLVLRRIEEYFPGDLGLVSAEAGILVDLSRPTSALKRLRKAENGPLFGSQPVERAELRANIAFLQWRLGNRDIKSTLKDILARLEQCGYASPRIAGMLPAFFTDSSGADRLEDVYTKLHQQNDESELLAVATHLSVLRGEFSSAVETAVRWASESPFNPESATVATHLLSEYSADFTRAADIGIEALKRCPASPHLANNCAYALAMLGRADEASRLLPSGLDSSPYVRATRALIELVRGDVAASEASYEQACELARAQDSPLLATLVALHRHIAFVRFRGTVTSPGRPDLPDGWSGNPQFRLFVEGALQRAGESD